MESSLTPATAETRPTFSIDWILGLDQNKRGGCLKLHRPWAEYGAEKENRGNSLCSKQQLGHHHQQQQHQAQQHTLPRPASNWYIGRRPRTAFTHSQVNALETVFQVNCYPGIQLREQLAGRLDLDEDRIQIWFQNRRAKLRRSLRETPLRFVQATVADLCVGHEVGGHMKIKQDGTAVPEFASPHQFEVGEEEEGCR
ncbi:homeobox expressed in ES cells 1 [Melanotaenia boesemani]|uniref:homeobox expressed in ES cells 1 n=1 Tax=Melanotaenia boesemani TaxID=1250792 RepID=UPI001C03B4EC|nr:homeobox expressed in ES cells 1 [Melanotaenia boesemani]